MIRRILFTLFALTVPAFAQVSVTISVPGCGTTNCFAGFPGSTRQLIAQIANGTLNTVTWSILSGTATISSPNSLGTALLTIGASSPSAATITPTHGNPGPFTTTGGTNVVVRATSVDDPTKHSDATFIVNPTIDQVHVLPAYEQGWIGHKYEFDCQIFGVAFENAGCTWTASGGTLDGLVCTSVANDCRTVEFTASSAGLYTITATENATPHNTATAKIRIATMTYPLSTPSTPQGTELQPWDTSDCTRTFNVGPTHTTHTISGAIDGSTVAGDCILIYNEDVTGLSPTTYAEYFQIINKGTQASPIQVIAVPDSLGNLPIITGVNASGNAGIANAVQVVGSSLVTIYSHGYSQGSCFGFYGVSPLCGPSYVNLANLHLANVTPAIAYFAPGSPTLSGTISRGSPFIVGGTNVVSVGSGQTDGLYTVSGTGGTCTGSLLAYTISGGIYVTGSIDPPFGARGTCTTNSAPPSFVIAHGGTPAVVNGVTYSTVTVTASAASSYGQLGEQDILISGTTGGSTSFNGHQTRYTASGTTLSWFQAGPTETGSATGATAQLYWGSNTLGGVLQETGDHISYLGLYLDNVSEGIFVNDNASFGWDGVSQDTTIHGSVFNQIGVNNFSLVHGIYGEGMWFRATNNLFKNPISGMAGDAIKWRGACGYFANNAVTGNWGGYNFDGVEIQGNSLYASMDGYLNQPSNSASLWALGDTGGVQLVTAVQECEAGDVLIGSIFDAPTLEAIHYGVDVDAGITSRTGQLIAKNLTLNLNNQQYVINNGSNRTGYNFFNFYNARITLANSSAFGTLGGNAAVNLFADIIATFKTNMWSTGQITLPPTTSGSGWTYTCDGTCPWQLTVPLNTHLTNITGTDFLTTSSNPVGTNYVPITSSPLIGAASSLSGLAAQWPVRYYYDLSTNSVKPRTDIVSGQPTTIGAVPAGIPIPSTGVTFSGHVILSGVKVQ